MIRSTLQLVVLAGAALAVYASNPVSAQVYNWTDEQGTAHYGDNPYSLKEATGTPKVIVPAKRSNGQIEPEPEPAPALEEREAQPAPEDSTEKPADGQPNPVEVVGDLEISASSRGLAVVRATIKSNVKYPVDGIRLDVILYHVEGRRAADLAIPFTGGKTRPDTLVFGEEGLIEEEVPLRPEDIAGYNYRVVWAFFDSVTPPKEGQDLPEDVHYKLIPGSQKAKEQAGAEQAKEPAKAPEPKPAASQEAPAEPKRGLKRVIKQKKLEQEKSGSAKKEPSAASAETP